MALDERVPPRVAELKASAIRGGMCCRIGGTDHVVGTCVVGEDRWVVLSDSQCRRVPRVAAAGPPQGDVPAAAAVVSTAGTRQWAAAAEVADGANRADAAVERDAAIERDIAKLLRRDICRARTVTAAMSAETAAARARMSADPVVSLPEAPGAVAAAVGPPQWPPPSGLRSFVVAYAAVPPQSNHAVPLDGKGATR